MHKIGMFCRFYGHVISLGIYETGYTEARTILEALKPTMLENRRR
jgi:hypothetical protein